MDDRQGARSVSPPSFTERHPLADSRNPSGNDKEATEIQKPLQARRPSLFDRLFRNSWLWEFLSAWFSLICLIVIVVVLRYEDGKQFDQWSLVIGPNAVISFIGALAKSAFMVAIPEIISQLKWLHYHNTSNKLVDIDTFDESSRGPWGASKLVILQNRKALLASWASIITIAALLIDPFLQLVFSFPSRLTVDPSFTPFMRASHIYDPNNYPWAMHGSFSSPSSVNTAMQSNLLGAAFGDNVTHPLTCQGTHCIWRNITSLGVCSSCQDAKDRVAKKCYIDRSSENYCNYTINGGTMLQATWGGDADLGEISTLFNVSGTETAVDVTGFGLGNTRIPEPAILASFASVKLVNLTTGGYSPAPTNATPLEAYTCEFHLCSKTYDEINFLNGTVTMSEPHEMPLSLYPNLNKADKNTSMIIPLGPPGNVSDIPPEQSFMINAMDYYALGGYLAAIFTVSLDSARSQMRPSNGLLDGLDTVPEIGIPLFESSDIPGVANAVAGGMTEAMRTNANSTFIYGTGENYKTFISVDFRWLALPAILIVMTIVLLVITVIISSRSNLPVWKSSGLAPFFHRLEGWDREDMHVAGGDQLHDRAKGMRATLSDDGSGVVFLERD